MLTTLLDEKADEEKNSYSGTMQPSPSHMWVTIRIIGITRVIVQKSMQYCKVKTQDPKSHTSVTLMINPSCSHTHGHSHNADTADFCCAAHTRGHAMAEHAGHTTSRLTAALSWPGRTKIGEGMDVCCMNALEHKDGAFEVREANCRPPNSMATVCVVCVSA